MQKNVKNLKEASKNATAKLVAESEQKNVIDNSKKVVTDDEILSKLDKISIESVATKVGKKQLLWKKEVLQSYKTEKTARRILRNKQSNLSKSVIKFAKLKDNTSLNSAKKELKNFYTANLVDVKNFSNISEESDKYDIIQLAYKLTFNAK